MNKKMSDPKKTRSMQFGVVIVGVVILLGIAVFSYMNNPATKLQQAAADRGERTAKDYDTPAKVVTPQEAWITKSEAAMQELQKRIEQGEKERESLKKQLELERSLAKQRSSAPVGDKVSLLPPLPSREDPNSPFQTTRMQTAEIKGETLSNPAPAPKGGGSALDKLKSPLLDEEPEVTKVTFQKKKGKDAKLHIRDTIPANSFFKSVLISGVDAPTGGMAASNPHPVLIEMVDNGSLPNNFKHKAKSCRVSGEVYGNLSDERAYARLTRMSCTLRSGEIVSQEVKGYIAGPDGKNGVRGKVYEKQGAMIARALLAGTFGAVGSAVSQTYTTLSQSPTGTVQGIDPSKTLEYGVGAGIGNAFEKIADWYLKRADELYPVISMNPGTVVHVVFTEDVKLGANLMEENS